MPSSYFFEAAFGKVLGLMMVGGGGGWGDETFGATSGSFASGLFASARCAASEAWCELSKGIKVVGMELQVEAEDGIEDMVEVGVGVEKEFSSFELGTLVKVWLVIGLVDDGVGVSAGLTTMYDGSVVGEGLFVTS